MLQLAGSEAGAGAAPEQRVERVVVQHVADSEQPVLSSAHDKTSGSPVEHGADENDDDPKMVGGAETPREVEVTSQSEVEMLRAELQELKAFMAKGSGNAGPGAESQGTVDGNFGKGKLCVDKMPEPDPRQGMPIIPPIIHDLSSAHVKTSHGNSGGRPNPHEIVPNPDGIVQSERPPPPPKLADAPNLGEGPSVTDFKVYAREVEEWRNAFGRYHSGEAMQVALLKGLAKGIKLQLFAELPAGSVTVDAVMVILRRDFAGHEVTERRPLQKEYRSIARDSKETLSSFVIRWRQVRARALNHKVITPGEQDMNDLLT